MEAFHHPQFYPLIDLVLTSKEKVKTLHPDLQENSLFFTDPPSQVVSKLSTAKVLYVHPDTFDEWTDILLFIHQKSSLPVKCMIFCDSDISFCYDHFEALFAFFDKTEFWIQNWLGYHPRATLLPIGVINQSIRKQESKKDSLLTLSPVKSYPGCQAREEFLSFFNTNPDIRQYILSNPTFEDYCTRVESSSYHTCPMGQGPDTFRFWESLFLGTIPVVKDDDFYDFVQYHYPELPMVRVKSWHDLPSALSVSPQPLPEMPYLYKDYWITKLNNLIK